MATSNKKQRRARAPLSRERVLRAALVLVDKRGVDALSMRKLARKLGVEAMSLYKHVANKEEVLDGIVDHVIGEIEVPERATGWRAAMRSRAQSARKVFLLHPWAPGLFESRRGPSAARLTYAEAVFRLLREGGFSVPATYRAFLLVDSYLYGFIMQELSWRLEELPPGEVEASLEPARIAAQYPHFAEVMGHFLARAAETPLPDLLEAEFERGLDLVLDAVAQLRS